MQATVYMNGRWNTNEDIPDFTKQKNPIKINDVQQFAKAALSEFWKNHPKVYRAFCNHLGDRIEGLKRGDFKEEAYIQLHEELPR